MNRDGSNPVQITDDPNTDGNPSWSPDGQKIAFMSDRSGNSEVYVMNADGSGVTRITFDPATDAEPRWSPDGTRFIFGAPRGAATRTSG